MARPAKSIKRTRRIFSAEFKQVAVRRRLERDGLSLASHPARAVDAPAVVPRGHVALVRGDGPTPALGTPASRRSRCRPRAVRSAGRVGPVRPDAPFGSSVTRSARGIIRSHT